MNYSKALISLRIIGSAFLITIPSPHIPEQSSPTIRFSNDSLCLLVASNQADPSSFPQNLSKV